MPNQFLSDEFGDIEDYFVTDYWLIDQFVGDTLFTWGLNSSGQLGDNTITARRTPVTTFAGGTIWKQVSVGSQHTAALKTDGSLWSWGEGTSGQLGTNNTTSRSTPVTTFAGGTNWKSVSTGQNHTMAIKTDGSLWVWGQGTSGQLGDSTSTTRNTPVTTFSGGTNWKSVAGGRNFSIAIKSDGSLWTWGANSFGQLGTNDLTSRFTPVTTFAGGNNWKSVSCGLDLIVAIKTDGSLWTCGRNNSGQLGDFSNTNRSTPVTTFAGGTNWKSVVGGYEHVAAIKTDGSLWTWGTGGNGQLGINNTTSRSTPVTTFAGGTNWKQVFGGVFAKHTAATKTDGSLWNWGINSSGALGDNTTTQKNVPVTTFAGGNNWKQVACGYDYTVAIQSGLNVDLS